MKKAKYMKDKLACIRQRVKCIAGKLSEKVKPGQSCMQKVIVVYHADGTFVRVCFSKENFRFNFKMFWRFTQKADEIEINQNYHKKSLWTWELG